jgi:hypothetical protein
MSRRIASVRTVVQKSAAAMLIAVTTMFSGTLFGLGKPSVPAAHSAAHTGPHTTRLREQSVATTVLETSAGR